MSWRSIFTKGNTLARFGRYALALLAGAWFCAVLGSSVWAQSPIERLVSPGPLSAAHANLESKCESCHATFNKGAQSTLCLDCHKEVARDVRNKRGFHGRSTQVSGVKCKTCHDEHKGRTAHIVQFDRKSFRHDFTDFPLDGGHARVDCASCHKAGLKFSKAPSACIDCHRANDPHKGQLGESCARCHGAASWKTISFDHSATRFALRGAHVTAACASCHAGQKWKGLDTGCVSCHADEDVHNGKLGRDCSSCHNAQSWRVSAFDHSRTKFPLFGKHATSSCASCHIKPVAQWKPPLDCTGCHAKDDHHDGLLGPDCKSCHNPVSWTQTRFDHARETQFALKGAHAKIACASCHKESPARKKLSMECGSCHTEDDPHKGQLGDGCARCHSDVSWKTGVRFDHGLTSFPLLGKHAAVKCEACHATREFFDAKPNCVFCHAEKDTHKGSLGADCAACHNPTEWRRWRFDHDSQTRFSLTGKHRDLKCASCHRESKTSMKLSMRCVSCHAADDKHRGGFGTSCERCHTTEAFWAVDLRR